MEYIRLPRTACEAQKYNLMKGIQKVTGLKELLIANDVYAAGGSITSVFSGNPIKDYDLYFRSADQCEKFRTAFINLEDHAGNNPALLADTGNALTYKIEGVVIQLIRKVFCATPEELLDNFDFTICRGAYEFKNQNDEFVLHERFLTDLAQRVLTYNIAGKYPISSLYRIQKYIKKGYQISASEIIKMSLCINNLHITTYVELKEQLEGIDTLVFKDLTDKLLDEKANEPYDFGYTMELINRAVSKIWENEEEANDF